MKHIMHQLLGLMLLVFGIAASCNAQQPQPFTLDQPIDLRLHKAKLMLVVGMLSVEKNIPIGIEFTANEKNEPKLDIDVNKAPLVDVLNLIVQQEPAYMWEFRDGVINFTPVQDRDPFFERLLNTSVRRFVSPKGNNKFGIRDALLKLPEISNLIIANGGKLTASPMRTNRVFMPMMRISATTVQTFAHYSTRSYARASIIPGS